MLNKRFMAGFLSSKQAFDPIGLHPRLRQCIDRARVSPGGIAVRSREKRRFDAVPRGSEGRNYTPKREFDNARNARFSRPPC
jgi:hypothetical protein